MEADENSCLVFLAMCDDCKVSSVFGGFFFRLSILDLQDNQWTGESLITFEQRLSFTRLFGKHD